MLIQFIDTVFVYHLQDENEIKWHSRIHCHDKEEFEVHYFIEGSGQFKTGAAVYTIKPGTLFICPPDDVHEIMVHQSDVPLTYYAILFKINENDSDLKDLVYNQLHAKKFFKIGTDNRFFFEEIMEKSACGNKNALYAAVYRFASFLYSLVEESEHYSTGSESNVHIERALKIMQSSIFEELSIHDIAWQLNLSEEYFIRLFKKKMKQTPKKYYTRLKIEAATFFLVSTDLTIQVIAERLKFYSEFHFSRTYKQYTGLSPSKYRKEFREQYKEHVDPVLLRNMKNWKKISEIMKMK